MMTTSIQQVEIGLSLQVELIEFIQDSGLYQLAVAHALSRTPGTAALGPPPGHAAPRRRLFASNLNRHSWTALPFQKVTVGQKALA